MNIVRANREDLDAILALQKLCYASEAEIYGPGIQPMNQTIDEVAKEFESMVFLKAVMGDRIVGSVRIRLKDSACGIFKLIVHPDFQNVGLGARLMSAAERYFPEAEKFELFTGARSEKNLYFYKKLGYKPVRTEEAGDGATLVFFEKMKYAPIDLGIDYASIRNHDDDRKLWAQIPKVEVCMVEQHEECHHKLGDTFVYENPYKAPEGLCHAIAHVIDLYIWRAAFGYPSWYPEDREAFFIHCPDRKGTVWRVKRVKE